MAQFVVPRSIPMLNFGPGILEARSAIHDSLKGVALGTQKSVAFRDPRDQRRTPHAERRTVNGKRSLHPELEVEFPAPIGSGMFHPELQVPQLSHH